MNDDQLQKMLRDIEVPTDLCESLLEIAEESPQNPRFERSNTLAESRPLAEKSNVRHYFIIATCLSLCVLIFAFRGYLSNPEMNPGSAKNSINGGASEGVNKTSLSEVDELKTRLVEVQNERLELDRKMAGLLREQVALAPDLFEAEKLTPNEATKSRLLIYAMTHAQLEWEGVTAEAKKVLSELAVDAGSLASQQARIALERNY